MADNVLAELKKKMDRYNSVNPRALRSPNQRAAAQADMAATQALYEQAQPGTPMPVNVATEAPGRYLSEGEQWAQPDMDPGLANTSPVMSSPSMVGFSPVKASYPQGGYDYAASSLPGLGGDIASMTMNNQRVRETEMLRRRHDALMQRYQDDPIMGDLMRALMSARDPQERRAIISQIRAMQ